jgi:hypothetical protein
MLIYVNFITFDEEGVNDWLLLVEDQFVFGELLVLFCIDFWLMCCMFPESIVGGVLSGVIDCKNLASKLGLNISSQCVMSSSTISE